MLAGILLTNYPGGVEPFAVSSFPWLGHASPIDVQFSVGLDGLSLWLFGLTALLLVTSVLISWESITDRPGTYYGLLLLLETGMLGVFVARDIILFYIFFEFTLIPLFFLIGIWGSEDRRYAAIKFFLFTLAGSLLTFLGLLSIVLWDHSFAPGRMTFSIPELTRSLAVHPLDFHLPVVDFLGAVRRFCHQSASLPAAHLVALGPHPGAGGRQRAVGRRDAEDRHLRFHAVQPADVARRHGGLRALDFVAVGDRHHLWGPGGADADRSEAADRLFQRQPLGLLHAGDVRARYVVGAGRACCK